MQHSPRRRITEPAPLYNGHYRKLNQDADERRKTQINPLNQRSSASKNVLGLLPHLRMQIRIVIMPLSQQSIHSGRGRYLWRTSLSVIHGAIWKLSTPSWNGW